MEKKYELTEETRRFGKGIVLHRIRALKDFGDVKKGDLGGFIEKEENLSQEGNCWVSWASNVHDDAVVSGNAIVESGSVCNHAKVYGNAKISIRSVVFGYAEVYDNAKVTGHSFIGDNVNIYGNAVIVNNCEIYGYSKIFGDAYICGQFNILRDAYISSRNDFIVIGPVYVHRYDIRDNVRFVMFYKTESGNIRVSYYFGIDSSLNFDGTIDEFKKHIVHEYNHNFTLDKSEYQMWSNVIASAYVILKGDTALNNTSNESSHDKSVTFDGIIDAGITITLHDVSQEEINGIRKFIEALGNDKVSYVDGEIAVNETK